MFEMCEAEKRYELRNDETQLWTVWDLQEDRVAAFGGVYFAGICRMDAMKALSILTGASEDHDLFSFVPPTQALGWQLSRSGGGAVPPVPANGRKRVVKAA